MKLKLRINRQSCRIDVPGPEPSLTELIDHIRDEVLTSVGLSPETDFSLSLNGSQILIDTGQNLSSCGVVSGDLIYVITPNIAPTDGAAVSAAPTAGADFQMSFVADDQSGQGASQSEEQGPPLEQPCCSTSAVECEKAMPSTTSVSFRSWGPMLCCEAADGEAPLPLEFMYQGADVNSPYEALVVAINLLMLETGFTGSAAGSDEMPQGWRSENKLYKLPYQHRLCENTPTLLVAVPIGPLLFINASMKVNTTDISRKLCLEPTDYVTDKWPGESAAAVFKDLRKLSQMFKDLLAYPLIAATREALSLPVAFGLNALPPEVLLRILRQMDVRSLLMLSTVCKHLNTWASDSTLWRYMCHRDFRRLDPDDSRNPEWKELYKRHYTRQNCFNRFPPIVPIPRPFPAMPHPFQPVLPHPDPFRIPPLPIFDPMQPLRDPFNPLPDPFRPLIDPLNPFPDPLPLRPRVDLIHPFLNRSRPPFSDIRRGRGHSWQRQGFR